MENMNVTQEDYVPNYVFLKKNPKNASHSYSYDS